MSIARTQKMLLHEYARAAHLNDPTYRNYLRAHAGVKSAADRAMSQSGFEATMAALETVLFQRVAAGEIPSPLGVSRYIRAEFYWRKKLPQTGFINSRQAHKINELWASLTGHLPPGQSSGAYLAGIILKATGRDVGFLSLTQPEAASLIDALQNRLAHCISASAAHDIRDQPLKEVTNDY